MKQKTLLLFTGLPGVGKSTLASAIGKKIQESVIIDLDDFKRTVVDSNRVQSTIDPPEVRRGYYADALRVARTHFETGTSIVIMEEVFHLQSLRTELELSCSKSGVRPLWIEILSPYAAVEQRLAQTPRAGHILSTDQSLNMYRLFEDTFEPFPKEATNHITIENTTSSVPELVKQILDKI